MKVGNDLIVTYFFDFNSMNFIQNMLCGDKIRRLEPEGLTLKLLMPLFIRHLTFTVRGSTLDVSLQTSYSDV